MAAKRIVAASGMWVGTGAVWAGGVVERTSLSSWMYQLNHLILPAVIGLVFMVSLYLAGRQYYRGFSMMHQHGTLGERDSQIRPSQIAMQLVVGTALMALPFVITALWASFAINEQIQGDPYRSLAYSQNLIVRAQNSQSTLAKMVPPQLAVFTVLMLALMGLVAIIKGFLVMGDVDFDPKPHDGRKATMWQAMLWIVFGTLGMCTVALL